MGSEGSRASRPTCRNCLVGRTADTYGDHAQVPRAPHPPPSTAPRSSRHAFAPTAYRQPSTGTGHSTWSSAGPARRAHARRLRAARPDAAQAGRVSRPGRARRTPPTRRATASCRRRSSTYGCPAPTRSWPRSWTSPAHPGLAAGRRSCWRAPATTASCAGSACRRSPAPRRWSWPQRRGQSGATAPGGDGGCGSLAGSEAPKDAGGAAGARRVPGRSRRWRPTPGSEEFRIILEEARTVCGEAALLAPGDPIPYIIELSVARGLGYRPADFEELWPKITAPRPAAHGRASGRAALLVREVARLPRGGRRLRRARRRPAPRRAPCWPRCRSSRSTSTCPRSTWSAASTRARSSTKADRGRPFAVHAGPRRPPDARRTSAICWSASWSAPSATPEAMEQLVHVDGHVGALPWSLRPQTRPRSTRSTARWRWRATRRTAAARRRCRS